jgi:hypothetical protein
LDSNLAAGEILALLIVNQRHTENQLPYGRLTTIVARVRQDNPPSRET